MAYELSKGVGVSPLFPLSTRTSKPPRPICKSALSLALVVRPKAESMELASIARANGLAPAHAPGQAHELTGICTLLKRLGVSYKWGRAHVHSSDLLSNKKMASIRLLHQLNETDPERYVLLYEDEVTYYRRAVVNRGWADRGQRTAIKV